MHRYNTIYFQFWWLFLFPLFCIVTVSLACTHRTIYRKHLAQCTLNSCIDFSLRQCNKFTCSSHIIGWPSQCSLTVFCVTGSADVSQYNCTYSYAVSAYTIQSKSSYRTSVESKEIDKNEGKNIDLASRMYAISCTAANKLRIEDRTDQCGQHLFQMKFTRVTTDRSTEWSHKKNQFNAESIQCGAIQWVASIKFTSPYFIKRSFNESNKTKTRNPCSDKIK